jgi:hypothetical protein
MKLLMCLECGDIFNLDKINKICSCGKTSGKYINDLDAEIKGKCKAIGFSNKTFVKAFQLQKIEDDAQAKINKPVCCNGQEFTAFFIPESATSIKRID